MTIDLSRPPYDQSKYMGRLKHFFRLTNPLNIRATEAELDEAKNIVENYKITKKMPPGYDEEKLRSAKYLYDSAFHPDTGQKMNIMGRMSAQAPVHTIIGLGLVVFYKTKPALIFWQWVNQTFNALVNYTNRAGDARLGVKHLGTSYFCACGGALSSALYLNNIAKRVSCPIFVRLVPFAGVCSANFINIPIMRSHELRHGTPVFTHPEGLRVGDSKVAARKGIWAVCLSRVFRAIPGLSLIPIFTFYMTTYGWFKNRPKSMFLVQTVLMSLCSYISTPVGCALFKQRLTLRCHSLEPELQAIIKKQSPKTTKVFFNKGL